MYSLITNKRLINKAQKQADNSLLKYYGRRKSTTQYLPARKKNTYPQPSFDIYSHTISKQMSNSISIDDTFSPFLQRTSIH